MKFVIYYHETDIPHYDLMIDNGEALETWRIQEDLFFDFISGCAVIYEKINNRENTNLKMEAPVDCGAGNVVIADQGEYSRDPDNRIILNGSKVNGTIVFNKSAGTMAIVRI